MTSRNAHDDTIKSFGDEWSMYDQASLDEAELATLFEKYFGIFPWAELPAKAEGFDMGCGSGRWASLVAPRVGTLNCIDPSADALAVARRRLAGAGNVRFHEATANAAPLPAESQDFGYSLGVLHHIPDTFAAMAACVELLRPGAPFLLYIYYRFDNRPAWYRILWQMTDVPRQLISKLPAPLKHWATDLIAAVVYWPLARGARLAEKQGLNIQNAPLASYRDASFYTMRTDSRDRFGTPLEQRFTADEIRKMMEAAGLRDIHFSSNEPFWCALGYRAISE